MDIETTPKSEDAYIYDLREGQASQAIKEYCDQKIVFFIHDEEKYIKGLYCEINSAINESMNLFDKKLGISPWAEAFAQGFKWMAKVLDEVKPDYFLREDANFLRSNQNLSYKKKRTIYRNAILKWTPEVMPENIFSEVLALSRNLPDFQIDNFLRETHWMPLINIVKNYDVTLHILKNSYLLHSIGKILNDLISINNSRTRLAVLDENIQLDEKEDKQLIEIWTAGNFDASKAGSSMEQIESMEKGILNQMRSARQAEKFMINFYRSLGYRVEDISVTQVQSRTSSWKTHDILLMPGDKFERFDSIEMVDVKNSRSAANRRDIYTRHCLSKKKGAIGYSERVKIAGVFSPYIKDYENIDEVSGEKLYYIGETSLLEITRMQREFQQGNESQLEIVSCDNDRSIYIPPWLFDNSKRLRKIERYAENEKASRDKMKNIQLRDGGDLVWAISLMRHDELVDSKAGESRSFEAETYSHLFIRLKKEITIGRIYFSILSHFVANMCKFSDAKFSPAQYRKYVFIPKKVNYRSCDVQKPGDWHIGVPLGVCEPLDLNIIDTLIDSLEKIWRNRDKYNLLSCKKFRLSGEGYLSAERDGRRITLLAHCGGRDYKKNRAVCGKYPLVIGKNSLCELCGKLICNEKGCQYCSSKCDRYRKIEKQLVASG
ncbi:MAG: hypothetical protein IT350_19270 [Deltaproteobacteria bacterium]|nr:hypothetical protein [Deltaproteobacteria bacterium]